MKALVIESDYKQHLPEEEGDPFYKLTEEDLKPGPSKTDRKSLPAKYDKYGLPLPSTIKVAVKKIFKGADVLNATKGDIIEIDIQNPWNYEFYQGKKYLMSGRKIFNKLFINMCDWNSLWKHVTDVQKWGLTRYYSANCNCSLVFNLVSDTEKYKPEKNECKWSVWSHEIGKQKSDCQSKNGICIYFKKYSRCISYVPKLPCIEPQDFP